MSAKNTRKICVDVAIAIFVVLGVLTMTTYAAEIHGMKWNDSNGNATRDLGEVGVQGVTICYYSNSPQPTPTGTPTPGPTVFPMPPYPGICTTTTDVDGNYSIFGLTGGDYIISEIVPPGKVQTYPQVCAQTLNCSLSNRPGDYHITVIGNEIITDMDFGNSDASEIRGMKFNDTNGDGIKNYGESGVSDIIIILKKIVAPDITRFVGYTYTDINGDYNFTNLTAGYYRVEESFQWGVSQTYPAAGAPYLINLGAGEVKTGVDFGNIQVPPGTISGTNFNDINENGVQDPDEGGVSGVTMSLPASGRTTVTGTDGSYTFNNVPVGPETVYENLPDGYLATTPTIINTMVNPGATSIINFGSRELTPPPSDVIIAQSAGVTANGIPTVMRPSLSTLKIEKTLTWVTGTIAGVNLTLKWTDGTIKTADMAYNVATGNWEANFVSPFSPGSAQMTFKVDVSPLGFDLNPSSPDFIEIGDIIFLDPSGQIRNSCNNQPIKDAQVTLYLEFPPGTFIKSPTGYPIPYQMPDTNPQITLEDGYYSWVVRQFNTYKVGVTRSGFVPNESEPFYVGPPKMGLDILLTPTSGCSNSFAGFFPPVENPPILNKAKAGSAIPLKFSLGGYQGLDIFETGYPKSSVISCAGTIDTIGDNETATAGKSGLSYDQAIDQYNYIWKTDTKWTGCRQLVMKFNDGNYHRANFLLSK